jgi:hypothetical protein
VLLVSFGPVGGFDAKYVSEQLPCGQGKNLPDFLFVWWQVTLFSFVSHKKSFENGIHDVTQPISFTSDVIFSGEAMYEGKAP